MTISPRKIYNTCFCVVDISLYSGVLPLLKRSQENTQQIGFSFLPFIGVKLKSETELRYLSQKYRRAYMLETHACIRHSDLFLFWGIADNLSVTKGYVVVVYFYATECLCKRSPVHARR